MAEALTLYTNPMSRGRIARWMLEEVGAPYETVVLDFGTTMKDEDYLALNPMGKVPAVRHGDKVVTECAAVCAYMADAFPEAGLAPAPADRADYYRWMFFAAGPVESAILNRVLEATPTQRQQMMAGYGSYETTMDTLEKAVSRGDFIAGDRFTAADVYVGSHIGWGTQFGTIEARPAFTAYVDRLYNRPAHIRATELDDALMPKEG